MNNERNQNVDMLRGVAILMVVLQHTISGSTTDFQTTGIFKVLWSLQMPLFMLISGYVTRYSKPITDTNKIGTNIKKRTVAYLLPWFVWTILVRGLLFGQSNFLNLKHLLWSMDSGYWFLTSLWTIAVCYLLAQFAAETIAKDKSILAKEVLQASFYVLCMIILAAIGLWQGLSFLGIKLTLYYMPFFYVGYLFGKYQELITQMKLFKVFPLSEVLVAVCVVAYVYLLCRFDFYGGGDGVRNVILRAVASMAGCIALTSLLTGLVHSPNVRGGGDSMVREAFIGDISHPLSASQHSKGARTGSNSDTTGDNASRAELCANLSSDCGDSTNSFSKRSPVFCPLRKKDKNLFSAIVWCGTNSLEIYLLHGLFLNIVKTSSIPRFGAMQGIALVLTNYFITIVIVWLIINLISESKILKRLLFWKK